MIKVNVESLKTISLVGFTIAVLSSCASMSPLWINKGAEVFKDSVNYFYGTGLADRVKSKAMQTMTAEHRARVEVARSVETYIASFLYDFGREFPDYFNPEFSGSEEYRRQVSKQITEQILNGCIIIDHWTDRYNGVMYALARMPKTKVDDKVIETMKKRKDVLLESRAEESLKKLEEELEKRDIREQKKFSEKVH